MSEMKLCDASDVELLCELIRRNGTSPSPIRTVRVTPHVSVLISIDADHTAELVLEEDDMDLVGYGGTA